MAVSGSAIFPKAELNAFLWRHTPKLRPRLEFAGELRQTLDQRFVRQDLVNQSQVFCSQRSRRRSDVAAHTPGEARTMARAVSNTK